MEDAQTSESELIGVGLDLELVSIVDQVFDPGERERGLPVQTKLVSRS
jgi:hypothetical protein